MKFGINGFAEKLSKDGVRLAALVAVSFAAIFFAISGTIKAAGTFAPTVTMELSTTRATAHPDARITIDNSGSDENIKSLALKLPNNFWGSLAAATKCDYDDAQDDNCTSASQIGTVDTTAKIDSSDSRLRGKVYMTEPAPANAATDPAGITVVVPAVVGSVDLGNVVVNARVQVRNATLPVTAVTGAVGVIEGVNTIVDSIPQHIEDTHGRVVAFELQKMSIDLSSKLSGPNPPLLTNPSTCSSIATSATFTSYDNSNAGATDLTPEVISDCSTVSFEPTVSVGLSSNVAGTTAGITAAVSFPENSASVKTITMKMPPQVGPNFASYGVIADQCDALSAQTTTSPFSPAFCPPQSKIGTVSLQTPLLDGPVVGNVYLIYKTPLPWLGIDISPSVSPSNPKGVTIRLVGVTNNVQVDPTCDPLEMGSCQSQITAQFSNIPDAPATSMSINLNGPDRAGVNNTLTGKILTIATANDASCTPASEFATSFVSNSGPTIRADRVQTQLFAGCNAKAVEIPSGGGSPVGTSTTDHTPSVPFTGTGPFSCYFDSDDNAESCTSPFEAPSNLSNGLHRIYVGAGSDLVSRVFVVQDAPPTPDTTAPNATITSPPTSVATDSPSFDFTSNESAKFQCAINPGNAITTAYLPCGSSSASTSGSFSAADLFAGLTYTVGVRAQDAAGNVDLTPATATFTVDIPFAPQIQADTTTSVARQHPDLDLTITNPSHEDIEDVTFSLPDGFFGGLTGVGSLCPLANADAGTCPASSQVGTVDAEADVDESTIRNSGIVYLTEPRDPANEPASLSIKLTPGIQDVVFNTIIVNASLKIRGVAQGIDTFALDLPKSATNTLDGTTEFDLRKMKLKLRTGAGATYPLLTNPSDCRPMSYDASFKGYDASTATDSQPFQATGCASLPFAPALAISALDPTGKPAGPSTNIKRSVLNVAANLVSTPNQAGIKNVVLTMPLPMTIDVQKLPPVCTIAQQTAKACPAVSQVGNVTATSPLLKEPLTGAVYILERNPATPSVVLPRLLIALRGRINVDIVATNSFVNVSQIVTRFDTLPDVPLSSFAININNFLTTRNNACDFGVPDWNITGTLTGFNGSASNVVIPQTFDCPEAYGPTAIYKLKKKKSKTTLSVAAKAQVGNKLKKRLTLTLPKGLSFNKAGFTKKRLSKLVTVRVNGKKLKTSTRCFKKLSSRRFQVRFCKKSGTTVAITFRSGTLKTTKKLAKKPKFKMTAVDSSNKTKTVKTLTD